MAATVTRRSRARASMAAIASRILSMHPRSIAVRSGVVTRMPATRGHVGLRQVADVPGDALAVAGFRPWQDAHIDRRDVRAFGPRVGVDAVQPRRRSTADDVALAGAAERPGRRASRWCR